MNGDLGELTERYCSETGIEEPPAVVVVDDDTGYATQRTRSIRRLLPGVLVKSYQKGSQLVDDLNDPDHEISESPLAFASLDELLVGDTLTGIETAQQLRELQPLIRILLLSGALSKNDAGDKDKLLAAFNQGSIDHFQEKSTLQDEQDEDAQLVTDFYSSYLKQELIKRRAVDTRDIPAEGGPKGGTIKAVIIPPLDPSHAKGLRIVTHGLGYQLTNARFDKEMYDFDWTEAAAYDYFTVIYDMIGHSRSRGIWTLPDAAKNISIIADWVTSNYDFANNDKVVLDSHSTGSAASLIASTRDKRIRAIAMANPITSLTRSFLYWFESGHIDSVRQQYQKDGAYSPPGMEPVLAGPESVEQYRAGEIDKEKLRGRSRYGLLKFNEESMPIFIDQVMNSPDLMDYAPSMDIPTITFLSEVDEIIPTKESERLHEAMKQAGNVHVLRRKAAHDHFMTGHWRGNVREATRFFDQHLGYTKG